MSFEVGFPPEELARLRRAEPREPEPADPTPESEVEVAPALADPILTDPPCADLPRARRRWRLPARGTLLGLLLGAVTAVVALRSFVFTAGYDTTLVANLGYVRAPAPGVVRDLHADVGDRVLRDQALGTFAVQVGLAAAMRAGAQDTGQLHAQLASIDARLAGLAAIDAQIRHEAGLYRQRRVAQYGALTAAAAADARAADARLAFAERTFERANALAQRGFLSAAGLERARQDRDAARADRAAAQARQTDQAIQGKAAGEGLLLGSSYGDVRYSTQRLTDIALARGQLQGERQTIVAALALARTLTTGALPAAQSQIRLPLGASVSGRVWAKAAAAGESLREGDPIYLLADCSSFFAYFSVGRSTYSTLKVGDPVRFISFANGDHWHGRIVNLGVNDPAQLRVTSQIDRPAPGKYIVGARIHLHPEDQRACPVGTPGRVVIDTD